MITRIDNYEINATLGEGAVATLYRAYDPERSSQVALKVFKLSADKRLLSHFRREGEVHRTLEHPNIPACYTYRESGDTVYMVMKYIQGQTLLEQLQRRNQPFDTREVITWAIVVCDILTYLHDLGFVYRDMKPSNLMLDKGGHLYLIDYGIIVSASGDGVAIGTIGYSPPEQYGGICTPQSDLYALGASLHHLLTNRDPRYHQAHSFHTALPRAYNSRVSPNLEAVIMKSLDPDPNARYESAAAMKEALVALSQ